MNTIENNLFLGKCKTSCVFVQPMMMQPIHMEKTRNEMRGMT